MIKTSPFKIIFASRDKRSAFLYEEFEKNCTVLYKYQEDLTWYDQLNLYAGALQYFVPQLRQYRQISLCSPYAIRYRSKKSFQAIQPILNNQAPDFIFQWGATYPPYYDPTGTTPFYLYTDSCCDPSDESYPWKWRPPRVSIDYTKEQHKTFIKATKIFTHSQWAKETIIKVHGLDASKLIVVGSGPAMPILSITFDANKKKNRIIFVGGDFHRKGVDLLRAALPLVLKEVPEAEFIIIGKHTDIRLEPHPAFKLLGPVYDKHQLAEYYATSKVFVLPSRFEPLGHVLWEAMAHYTPVIVSDVGGMPETVQTGYNGYIFPKEDVPQLASFILKILQNPDLSNTLALNARTHYEKKGTWHHVFSRMMNGIDNP